LGKLAKVKKMRRAPPFSLLSPTLLGVARFALTYCDALKSYEGLAGDYAHKVVDHAVEYVDGRVHTNGLENFWSLLKRGINGTYVSVEPFHLFRYLDEQAYRYNNRKLTDGERFDMAVQGIVGKRLTFAEVTGKESAQPF
jgi:hypothetical protein